MCELHSLPGGHTKCTCPSRYLPETVATMRYRSGSSPRKSFKLLWARSVCHRCAC